MAGFSFGDAVAAPFRLAVRRPVSRVVWGLLLVSPVVPALFAFKPLGDELGWPEALAADVPSSASLGALLHFQVWNGLSYTLQMLTLVVVGAAMIRAVRAGGAREGAAFLRLGIDELRVAVVWFALCLGAVAAGVVLVMLLFALGLALGQDRLLLTVAIAMAVGGMALVGGVVLMGRLSLMAPACLEYRSFAFVEGWRLGRGQTWPLAGLVVAMMAVAALMAMAVLTLLIVIVLVVSGVGGWSVFEDEAAWMSRLEAMRTPAPWMIGVGLAALVPLAWFQALSHALMAAPYAQAARDLAGVAPISADTALDAG